MGNIEKPRIISWRGIFSLIIVLLIVVFAVQNGTITSVKLWFWEFKSPLVMILLCSYILGLLFAILALIPYKRQSKRQNKVINDLNIRIQTLEDEIKSKPKEL